jgi:hypothetical protein
MALYLGSKKVNINLGSLACYLNLYTPSVLVNGVMLLSSDNYTLKDFNGVYLTAKESE